MALAHSIWRRGIKVFMNYAYLVSRNLGCATGKLVIIVNSPIKLSQHNPFNKIFKKMECHFKNLNHL